MYSPAIDTDIPLTTEPPTFEDLRARVDAAFESIAELGYDVDVTDDDIADAHTMLARNRGSEAMLSSPGAIVHVRAILSEYDREIVATATKLRTYVTNRLIVESADPNPTIRLRALEMLGKIGDVGLFTEKTEITHRHRPTAELEQILREKLEKLSSSVVVDMPHNARPQNP